MIFLLALAAFAATYAGGYTALRLHVKDKLHLVTGFSAGAIIGVAFFDLLPEATELLEMHGGISLVSTLLGVGFVVYLLLDRWVLHHSHGEDEAQHAHSGTLGAMSLAIHSLVDGLAIGLAFQVSTQVGWIVTTAVLAHDFSDGINTVNIVLKNTGERSRALAWLFLDALAPVVGVAITYLVAIPSATLGGILAFMCGLFLYIGASDLLPESHHAHPKRLTTVLTLAGIVFMYLIIRIAGS